MNCMLHIEGNMHTYVYMCIILNSTLAGVASAKNEFCIYIYIYQNLCSALGELIHISIYMYYQSFREPPPTQRNDSLDELNLFDLVPISGQRYPSFFSF